MEDLITANQSNVAAGTDVQSPSSRHSTGSPRPLISSTSINSSSPAIEVRELTRRYWNFTAVDKISFSIAPGTIFSLLGTNGAGKTTTIETILGLNKADGGYVRLLGFDPAKHRRELAEQVSVIGQDTGFADDLTVNETLELWAGLHRLVTPSSVLTKVDLMHRSTVRVGALSGGEKRRLDLALALVNQPAVLVADEPTTGLDPRSRQRTWEILRELSENGTTILLTTHYLDEAEELSDQLAIMNQGKIVAAGTVAEVTASIAATISGVVETSVSWTDIYPQFKGNLSLHNGEFTIRTQNMQEDLYVLLDWAHCNDIVIEALNAHSGSLEELFTSIDNGTGA